MPTLGRSCAAIPRRGRPPGSRSRWSPSTGPLSRGAPAAQAPGVTWINVDGLDAGILARLGERFKALPTDLQEKVSTQGAHLPAITKTLVSVSEAADWERLVDLAEQGHACRLIEARNLLKFIGDLEYRANWIATVIKSGPLLGLFGTVLGQHALGLVLVTYLVQKLRTMHAANAELPVMISADKDIKYDEVIQVIEDRRGIYRKLIIRDGRLVGAVVVDGGYSVQG